MGAPAVRIQKEDEEVDKGLRFARFIKASLVSEYTYIAEDTKSLDGRFTGECYLVTRWTPLEISVVSVPADASVGIGRSMDHMKDLMSRGEKDKQVDGVIAKYRAKAEKYQRFSNIL